MLSTSLVAVIATLAITQPPIPPVEVVRGDTTAYAPVRDSLAVPNAEALPLARGPIADAGVALSIRPSAQDTVRRPRPKAVIYSDGYSRRLTVHKTLSWAMLPLFAASYLSGDQILSKGVDAPGWAEAIHEPAAMGTAALFGVNTVTGAWNLWEGRADPNGRTRRIVHSVLFTAASAGFAYTGMRLAEEAEESVDGRRRHRNMALGSMGLSTASWLIMLVGN